MIVRHSNKAKNISFDDTKAKLGVSSVPEAINVLDARLDTAEEEIKTLKTDVLNLKEELK